MQTVELDLSCKKAYEELYPTIFAKQGDVGRKFKVIITDEDRPYSIPTGAFFSLWYFGTSGEGNYSKIGDRSAFSVEGNTVTVEMIAQMLTNDGGGSITLLMHGADGTQIGLWNFPYSVEKVRGMESAQANGYFTALTEAASMAAESAARAEKAAYMFRIDATLSAQGESADAKAVGEALATKAELLQVYPVGSVYMSFSAISPASLFGGTWEQILERFLLSSGGPYAVGSIGGESMHALTVDEMPTHDHKVHTDMIGSDAGGIGSNDAPYLTKASKIPWYGNPRTGEQGGGGAHNNMPPYLVVNMWKRVA